MRIGIDLGGSKIEAAIVDDHGDIARRLRRPTPRDYGDLMATISAMVDALAADGAVQSVGIGTPGAVCPVTGVIRNAENTPLDGNAFDRDLAGALGLPVRVGNDAHCFALSEATDGAAQGARVVFGAILGTGVGGGLVIDGALLTGASGIAGEWGHNTLPWPTADELPGPPCYCGQRGCLERFLAGEALQRQAGGVEPAELARRAAQGQPQATALLERYADRLARALASVINLVDPDVIVLGGGLSNITALYALVPQRWRDYVVGRQPATRLVRAQYGDASGVRGAARLR